MTPRWTRAHRRRNAPGHEADPEVARAYQDTMLGLTSLREWIAAAVLEREFVEIDEPYRLPPA